MSNNHVIELNGNKYDALTGKIIASPTPSSRATQTTHKPMAAPSLSHATPQPMRRTTNVARPSPTTPAHHKPAKSHTLMRSAVKKPAPSPIHTVTGRRPAHTKVTISKHKNIISPANIDSVNPHRIARAQNTMKSSLVSKFGYGNTKSTMAVAEIPVKPAPRHHAQAPARVISSSLANSHKHDPFEEALKNAVSHEQPKLKKQHLHHRIARKLGIKPRTLMIGTGGVTVLLIGSFIAYTRVPSVGLKVASTKAGINATLPAYQPAGFSLKGPISAAPGEISLIYKSNSDDRDFTVTQKSSTWNSETLLNNLATAGKQASYQTFQSGGRTIYIYDGGNATWVDGGIWYKIEGNSSLNSDQLLRIANSL